MGKTSKLHNKEKLRNYYNERFIERYSKSKTLSEEQGNIRPQYLSQYFHGTLHEVIIENLSTGDRILDLGCGEGNNFKLLQGFKKVVMSDFSYSALTYFRNHYQADNHYIINSDAVYIPFKNDCFDFVTLIEVIEHIHPDDSLKVIKEIYRVLHKGGGALLTTPNGLEFRRSILELPLRIISKISVTDINFIKSKLFTKYLALSGAKCSSSKSMIKHNFTEHINILTPSKLRNQIVKSGLLIDEINFIYVTPFIQRPFQLNKTLVKILRNIERKIRNTPLRYLFLSGMVFKVRKP